MSEIDGKDDSMGVLSHLTRIEGAFCEIKRESGYVIICTGNIISIDEEKIVLKNKVSFMPSDNFKGIITILSQSRGIQVFKADIKQISNDTIVYENLERIINSDRRTGYRLTVGLPALVTVDSEPSVGYDTIIQDVSISGISISIHKSFEIDELIRIQFPLDPDDTHICVAECNVVRTIGSTNYSMRRYGCEFVNMTPMDKQLVKSYLTKLRTKQIRIEQSFM